MGLNRRAEARRVAEEVWQAWNEGEFSGDLLTDWLWHLANLLIALEEHKRAGQVLLAAHSALERMAAAIQDEAHRQAFFEHVFVHRHIRDAFTAIHNAAPCS